MHSVKRNPPPAGVDLVSYEQSGSTWNTLSKEDYAKVLAQLCYEFGGLCAYCERKVRKRRGQPGPVDHFKPRNPPTGSQTVHFGSDMTFKWLNLVYACTDCQSEKSNKWPGTMVPHAEALIYQLLEQQAKSDGWTYTDPSVSEGYVDPSDNTGASAQSFFEYDPQTCQIAPSQVLDNHHRSRALRTIQDIGLGGTELSQERLAHLMEVKQHITNKGTRNTSQEAARLFDQHERRGLGDTKASAYEVPARFTGLIMFAYQSGWLS